MVVDRGAAGGLAEEGDAGGVAAEGGDVVAHPFEGEALVEEAQVLVPVRVAREAEDGEAVAALEMVSGGRVRDKGGLT